MKGHVVGLVVKDIHALTLYSYRYTLLVSNWIAFEKSRCPATYINITYGFPISLICRHRAVRVPVYILDLDLHCVNLRGGIQPIYCAREHSRQGKLSPSGRWFRLRDFLKRSNRGILPVLGGWIFRVPPFFGLFSEAAVANTLKYFKGCRFYCDFVGVSLTQQPKSDRNFRPICSCLFVC